MKNIWLSLIPTLLIIAAFIIGIIVLAIKHTKTGLGWMVILIICVTCFIWPISSRVRDLANLHVETFEGEFNGDAGRTTLIFCSTISFKNSEGNLSVSIPNFEYSKYKLKKGQKYIIKYSKYSHTLCDAILIETM